MLAFTFTDFAARVSLTGAARIEIGDGLVAETLRDAVAPGVARQCEGATALMTAAATKLVDHAPHLIDGAPGFRLRVASDIPRQAGLAGSSAIVIAALRALAAHFAIDVDAPTLAALALAAETDVLDITAGPMDRVVQAHEGLLHMDFRRGAAHTRLDPALLPQVFIAWDPMPGESSGAVHERVRERWERGEVRVVEAVAELASLADEGLGALRAGDVDALCRLIDRSFIVRAGVWTLAGRDRDMIEIARQAGVPTKLCGSGGAIVGVLRAPSKFEALAAAYRHAGYRTLRPRVGP